MVRMFLVLFIALTSVNFASADVLFEAYSRVLSQREPIGYVITRYEFNPKTRRFSYAQYLKTGKSSGIEATESLKAQADSDLNPISYEYTSVVGKETKTIDATFKGTTMTANVKSGGKSKKVTRTFDKGTFLSPFLYYLILKSPNGLQAEKKYSFKAFAEEDAEIFDGEASIGKAETYAGLPVYRVQNKFKGVGYTSFVTDQGEIIATDSAEQGVSTEVVATAEQATKGFPVSEAILKTLFGSVPKGIANIVARKAQAIPGAPASKDTGTPANSGILIKSGSATDETAKQDEPTKKSAKKKTSDSKKKSEKSKSAAKPKKTVIKSVPAETTGKEQQ